MNDLSTYNEFRPQMDTMDLLQWKTDSFVGWSIRFKTGSWNFQWKTGMPWMKRDLSEWNHTGGILSFPDISRERKWTGEAVGKGLMINYLSLLLENHKGEVWWFPLKDKFKARRNAAAFWLMERIGTEYDYGSLFRNLAGKVSADAGSLFCSEAYFLAWHWVAVSSRDPNLSHLCYQVDNEEKKLYFVLNGMEKYYQMRPEERPKSPVPADILDVLKVYKQPGYCILKS